MSLHKREFKIMEGRKDIQRKWQDETSRVQSKLYSIKNSPRQDTESTKAESIPKRKPKAAPTSCHLSSCCPAALTWQQDLRPWPCLFPWTLHPWQLGPSWPFVFQ